VSLLESTRGSGKVQFGGPRGRVFTIKSGDVAILSAGTGHRCLGARADFLVIGAYPRFGTYDECRATAEDHRRALSTIPKVGRPRKDPVFGAQGPLLQIWKLNDSVAINRTPARS